MKNRFASNTIGKLLRLYRTFDLENKVDNFKSIVMDSLLNAAKTENFMSLIHQIIEQENKYVHFDSIVEMGVDENGNAGWTSILPQASIYDEKPSENEN